MPRYYFQSHVTGAPSPKIVFPKLKFSSICTQVETPRLPSEILDLPLQLRLRGNDITELVCKCNAWVVQMEGSENTDKLGSDFTAEIYCFSWRVMLLNAITSIIILLHVHVVD